MNQSQFDQQGQNLLKMVERGEITIGQAVKRMNNKRSQIESPPTIGGAVTGMREAGQSAVDQVAAGNMGIGDAVLAIRNAGQAGVDALGPTQPAPAAHPDPATEFAQASMNAPVRPETQHTLPQPVGTPANGFSENVPESHYMNSGFTMPGAPTPSYDPGSRAFGQGADAMVLNSVMPSTGNTGPMENMASGGPTPQGTPWSPEGGFESSAKPDMGSTQPVGGVAKADGFSAAVPQSHFMNQSRSSPIQSNGPGADWLTSTATQPTPGTTPIGGSSPTQGGPIGSASGFSGEGFGGASVSQATTDTTPGFGGSVSLDPLQNGSLANNATGGLTGSGGSNGGTVTGGYSPPTGDLGAWGQIGTGNPGGMTGGGGFTPNSDTDGIGPFGNSTPVFTTAGGGTPDPTNDPGWLLGGSGSPGPVGGTHPPAQTPTPTPAPTGGGASAWTAPDPINLTDPSAFQSAISGTSPSGWDPYQAQQPTAQVGGRTPLPGEYQGPNLTQGGGYQSQDMSRLPAGFGNVSAAQATNNGGQVSADRAGMGGFRAQAGQAGPAQQAQAGVADGSFGARDVAMRGLNAPSLSDVDRYSDLAMNFAQRSLDPQWQQDREAFDQRMVSQGIYPGTEAYDKAHANFSRAKNDAYNSARFGAFTTGTNLQDQMFQQGFQRSGLDLTAQQSNQSADIARGNRMVDASIANAGFSTQASGLNATNSANIGMANAANQTQASGINANNSAAASRANAANSLAASQSNAANSNALAMANAQMQNQLQLQQMGLANDRDIQNARNALDAARLNEQSRSTDNALNAQVASDRNNYGLSQAALANQFQNDRFGRQMSVDQFNSTEAARAADDAARQAAFQQSQYLDNNRLGMDMNAQNFGMNSETDQRALQQMLGLMNGGLTARGQDINADLSREQMALQQSLSDAGNQNISAEDMNRIYNSGIDSNNMQAMQMAMQMFNMLQNGDMTNLGFMFP